MDDEHHYLGLTTGRRLFIRRVDCDRRSLVPHPSLAIVKFWQGRIEVVLRLLSALCSGLVLGPSVWVLSSLGFPDTERDIIEASRTEAHRVIIWVVTTAVLGILVQVLMIIGRFLNFEFATTHTSQFQILDIVSSVTFTSAYFTLFIPLFVYSQVLVKFADIFPEMDSVIHYLPLRRRYLITASLCCLSCILFLVLSIWMSLYLSFKWDKKLTKCLRQAQNVQTLPPTTPEQV